jgi:hypothetical protein
MSASVTVEGRTVTFLVRNETRHREFRKVLRDAAIDLSSAEWIAEAPSNCNANGTGCVTLPLTNFRSVTFDAAVAEVAGHALGSISDPLWHWTRINLRPRRGPLRAYGSHPSGSTATPSALLLGGTSFSVGYSRTR